MLGKSETAQQTAGTVLYNSGQIYNTASGTHPLVLTRKTNDGAISIFYKDTNEAGRIGVAGSNIYLTQGSKGIGLSSARVYPITNAGAVSDNTMDLGNSDARFVDAYLSGGVYLGGTAAANKLDDYEEGTFLPIISGGSNAGTVNYNTRIGQYTKVGNLVTVWMNINWSSGNGSGSLMVKGLPFSVINTARPVFNVISENVSLASNQLAAGFSNFSDGVIMVRNITGTGATLTLTYDSAGSLFLTGTYPTTQ